MNDFIAKKREIFLVQMSLDTKRAEITKLEERALQVHTTCSAYHCMGHGGFDGPDSHSTPIYRSASFLSTWAHSSPERAHTVWY